MASADRMEEIGLRLCTQIGSTAHEYCIPSMQRSRYEEARSSSSFGLNPLDMHASTTSSLPKEQACSSTFRPS